MTLASLRVTQDGSLTLYDQTLGQAYHSDMGALTEAKTLYIERSGFVLSLKQRLTPVSVLDVGLGLGYNALSTIEAWKASGSPSELLLTSLESQRELYEEFRSGEASWQRDWSEKWKNWAKGRDLSWDVRIGLGQETILPLPQVPYHFIWQDPFSPEKNPDLWTKEWFAVLRERASPHCVLMTYSVSRQVKDALTLGGWTWEKIPGMGTKREWLRAKPSEIVSSHRSYTTLSRPSKP